MARYIYLMERGETICDRYRVLEAGERLGDIDEIDELTGVISAAVADAYKMILEEKYREEGFSVHEAHARSWSEAKRRGQG